MKVTQLTTRYTKTNSGYEVISAEIEIFDLSDDEDFPKDYWVNELKQVQFTVTDTLKVIAK